jgi:hypothetical protein
MHFKTSARQAQSTVPESFALKRVEVRNAKAVSGAVAPLVRFPRGQSFTRSGGN